MGASFKLYMFLADWCGHCKAFKKNVLGDESKVAKIKDMGIKIVKLSDADAQEPEFARFNVRGFPAFRLVVDAANEKLVWEYDGFGDWKKFSEELEKSTSESSQ